MNDKTKSVGNGDDNAVASRVKPESTRSVHYRKRLLFGLGILSLCILDVEAGPASFIGPLNNIKQIGSTVPGNYDVNPYGVAVVPRTIGSLVAGHILVSNFNNSANLQGTGTTIDDINPNGNLKVFARLNSEDLDGRCPGGVGLTTALVVLRAGWVIVGSLPTKNGMASTANAGCLIVLNRFGEAVETFSGGGINGPWDMTALDQGNSAVLFVTNVLNGTVAANGKIVNRGTVLRIVLALGEDDDEEGRPREVESRVIADGFAEQTDPNALVVGPTGLGLGRDGTLYVADTLANRIAAIPNARYTNDGDTGKTVSAGGALNRPLGLAITPNGDIVTVNSNDGNMVEITPGGAQMAVKAVDTTGIGAGTLFGLALTADGTGVYFVNDGDNTLRLLH